MCESLERRYREKEQQTMLRSIKNLMETMKWNAEQAMDALKISSEQRSMYAGLVKQK